MNSIYIRRRSKVTVPASDGGTTPLPVLAALQKNLESLGYLLSEEVIRGLGNLSRTKVEGFYHRLTHDLQVLVGAHRPFEPFYPNFPAQVMEMEEAELYFRAIMYYWTLDRQELPAEPRPPLQDRPALRVIRLGDTADFNQAMADLMRSRVAYSPQDKEDIAWLVSQYRDDVLPLLPASVTSRENLAYLGSELVKHTSIGIAYLDSRMKTATDVLRLAVALSGGDVSLAEPVRFGKIGRRLRLKFLAWLETFPNRVEDMLRWKPRWIRLGERLHPGEYASRFPETAKAFDVLRNNLPSPTLNSALEAGLLQRDVPGLLQLLKRRPGEFARRLDHLIRISSSPDEVVAAFSQQAHEVSTSVLLQCLVHFRHRHSPVPLRAFFPKGTLANVFATTEPLPPIPPAITKKLVAICDEALLQHYAKLPPLGRCYLDPGLKDYQVPFALRSASKSLRTLVRGSRLPLPDGEVLRFFIWWKNGRSRVDIDLSATMYDEKFQYVDLLSYYSLKNFGGHHSGDIVDAPHGAAEFIDVTPELCRQKGVRYIVMSLHSFTEQPYCELPECFAGWMARSAPNSGEIFEPSTVVDKVDVAANTRICLPAIFDLVDRKVIWADIALTKHPRVYNNVHSSLRGVSLMVRTLAQLRKPDLHTLFDLHIRARGQQAASLTEADTVFAVEQGITPFDLDHIKADFL
jgi:hypothetical protein